MQKTSMVRVVPALMGMTLGILALSGTRAAAEEIWTVRSGDTSIHFNTPLLGDLGIEITDITGTLPKPSVKPMELPNWTFAIDPSSDFQFRTLAGVPVPGGIEGGAIHLDGAFTIVNSATGKRDVIGAPEIVYIDPQVYAPEDLDVQPSLYMRAGVPDSPLVFEIHDSMFRFDRENHLLYIHYMNTRVSKPWAERMGRPDLAGWFVGNVEIVAQVELVAANGIEPEPYVPDFASDLPDVKLGILDSIQQAGHEGTYPNGTAGLTMSTTSCNVGTVDVPWLAPMQEDHPLIHMALYRLKDGRFEQVGVSWMKHGFFALSSSQCTPCQHPSNGTFLGVGCSDTYGPGNNQDRNYLGPRSEVDPFLGTWECTGSHFAGGQPDCVRRHTGSGHGPVDHRLQVQDADLGDTGAEYFYESYYVVRNDGNKTNNWGSRRCTMSWNGSAWSFTTPSSNNPLIEGPALGRWGDQQTTINVAADDGEVMLAVVATDLGNGVWHYEYALLNQDSDRELRSFSLPVVGVSGIANLSFHDNDADAGNDWQVTLDSSTLTWSTETYDQNPNANSLVFGYMFNFRFDAEAPPAAMDATLGIFKPGTGTEVPAATTAPQNTVLGVPGAPVVGRIALMPARPNPFSRSVVIPFELNEEMPARLDIYDASGRLVRTLSEGNLAAGSDQVVWDGKDSAGKSVPAGVFYARLSAGGTVAVQPMVLVK
jgi:hypothetical protein